jgi:AcrR family transcriptional regulator
VTSGRRPGNQDTKGAILAAARAAFAERGYAATSIRRVAAAAGVDPALVHHYFGSKEDLFTAVVAPPVDPAVILRRVLAGDAGTVGERVVRTFLGVWDDPVTGPAFHGLLRGAVEHDESARLLREFFAARVVRRLADAPGSPVARDGLPLRASLVASQLFGLALARYVLGLPPLARASPDTVVAAVAPTVQRYLTGPM